uniref:Uncharacterized protein n=1 Tax=Chrysolophus pictus TaxID=9089 RepID=A0A8C3LP17_CHRPC
MGHTAHCGALSTSMGHTAHPWGTQHIVGHTAIHWSTQCIHGAHSASWGTQRIHGAHSNPWGTQHIHGARGSAVGCPIGGQELFRGVVPRWSRRALKQLGVGWLGRDPRTPCRGPKYHLLAHTVLSLAEVQDGFRTHDLAIACNEESSFWLPLYGSMCCRLAAQPHCMAAQGSHAVGMHWGSHVRRAMGVPCCGDALGVPGCGNAGGPMVGRALGGPMAGGAVGVP